MKRICSSFLALSLVLSLCLGGAYAAGETETRIVLSDSGVTVDGAAASADASGAVYVGAEIVYYHDGTDSAYGEGAASEMHSAEEAAAHTVVTITQPGTYRVSGSLSLGQLAIDLGEDAADDPSAVVTLILDNVDLTCTVAPAVIFYNVYECGSADVETAQADVDTAAAGANVVLAAGSVNNVTGSHVARIYKEGTTKKLHKYDAAFYSKMTMNISGDNGDDSGVLNIVADNEGLDSELHLTINGGTINIQAQDDGINTNEDGVSVTTVNGGSLHISAGLGAEGDGIDSNGYLVINGGTVWTMANEQSPDGGIDADQPILINGGTVYAFGTRNDAVSTDSKQVYMELSFGSTLSAGTEVRVTTAGGAQAAELTLERACQSITLSVGADAQLALEEGETYYVYVNGVQQQYTGNAAGMGGFGGFGGGQRPDMGELPEGFTPPEGMEEGQFPGGMTGDGQRPERPEGEAFPEGMEGMETMTPPEGMEGMGQFSGTAGETASGEASTDFTLTETIRSFSGIGDWAEASGKTAVTFTVNGGMGVQSAASGGTVALTSVTAAAQDGSAVELDASHVQLTVTDVPSEDYAATCLLSDGAEALAALMPTADGTYRLTAAVLSVDETYAGTASWTFTIGGTGFTDVSADAWYADSVTYAVSNGLLNVTGNRFQPNASVTAELLGGGLTVSESGALTRLELVEALWQASGSPAGAADLSGYADGAAADSDPVRWAVEQGILQGRADGSLDLSASLTRAEAAALLERWSSLAG